MPSPRHDDVRALIHCANVPGTRPAAQAAARRRATASEATGCGSTPDDHQTATATATTPQSATSPKVITPFPLPRVPLQVVPHLSTRMIQLTVGSPTRRAVPGIVLTSAHA
jgi:hypothetical protein